MPTIQYSITFEDGRSERFEVVVEEQGVAAEIEALPPAIWTRLERHQCENCPLSPTEVRDCPLAVRLAPLLVRFGDVKSTEPVSLVVTTPERHVGGPASAQHAIGSLMGLLMASSDCPHTRFLRPMARFHLPLASVEETSYRVLSMHALRQLLRARSGETPELEFEGLLESYRQLETVNYGFAARVRAASQEDGTPNAIVMLDAWAKLVPTFFEETLEELARYFEPAAPGA